MHGANVEVHVMLPLTSVAALAASERSLVPVTQAVSFKDAFVLKLCTALLADVSARPVLLAQV